MTVILFFIVLSVLVVVHELGHFLIAKKFGIRVDEFGLGFPPRIFGKKFGDTVYSLNWIPFGGFVKIFGENGERQNEEEAAPAVAAGAAGPAALSEAGDFSRGQNFQKKNRAVQTFVLVGGVLFNLLFAWLLISFGFVSGFPAPAAEYAGRGTISEVRLVVTDVLKDSPATRSGIKIGDAITALKAGDEALGGKISPEALAEFVRNHGDDVIEISTKRGGLESNISVKPEVLPGDFAARVGVGTDEIGLVRMSLARAFLEGARTTIGVTVAVGKGLYYFAVGLTTGQSSVKDLTGPIGIAGLVGEAGRLGFVYLLSFTAFISINLAVLNLAPFPALDGGRIVMVGIEAIIRRPLPRQITGFINALGFLLLLSLMLLVTYRDIRNIL